MNKKFIAINLILALCLIAGLSYGCSPANQKNDSGIEINIATLRGSTAVSLIQMIDAATLIEGSAKTNYEIIATPDLLVSKILSNEVDIATIPTNVAAKLYNNGIHYQLGAVTGWGVLYMLSSDQNVKKIEDLKDQTIYTIAKGSTPDILLRYILEVSGLEAEKDYKIDYSFEQIELTQLLIAGRADIAMLPEPFVTRALMQNEDLEVIADIQKEWEGLHGLGLPQTAIFISSEFIDNNPEIVDNFLKEAEESIQWANTDIEAVAELAEKYEIGLDKASAMQSIPRSNIIFKDAADSLESLEKYFSIISGFSPEDIGGKIPSEDFYYIKK